MKPSVVFVGFESDYANQLKDLLLAKDSNWQVEAISCLENSHIKICQDADIAVLNGYVADYVRWFKRCANRSSKVPPASLIVSHQKTGDEYVNDERRISPRLHITAEELTANRLADVLQQLLGAKSLSPGSLELTRDRIQTIADELHNDDSSIYEVMRKMSAEPRHYSEESIHKKETYIDGYKLNHLLGRGGMGAVYQALSPDNKEVAIKLLDMGKVTDDRELDRFIREYELLLKVEHPSIIKVYKQGFAGKYLYIVMELLSSDCLKARIQKGLPVEDALKYAIDLSGALGTMHDLGILHRDIKPNNILFNNSGNPVITDFGVSKMAGTEKDLELTMMGESVGTPAYMSPEQAIGHEATTSSDLYSFGVMLYQMLTGKLPFKARSLMQMLQKQSEAPPPRLPPELIDLDPIIRRLLRKQPTQRYHSAWDLQKALKQFVA